MYFQRIGASGYALGAIKMKAPPIERGFWLSYASLIDDLRESMDKRIRAAIPGDSGSIASALITGKRDAISTPVNDAMYVSSLAHVLSISGYHTAVVAGIMFFFIRAVLALIPSLASRHPIKKWAVFGALIASAFYLLLSGTEVATQRSFIMIATVLIGVMLDRPTLTFRTLAVAAIVVLSLAPQAIVHPSSQMSFAATLALVAAYQNGMPWQSGRDSSRGRRVALWGVRELFGLLLASLVAGSRNDALCHLPLSPAGALRCFGKSPRYACGLGCRDADGNSGCRRYAFWLRWCVLVSHGRGHRLDGLGRPVGWQPAWGSRTHTAFGTGPLLVGTAGHAPHLPLAHGVALERGSIGAWGQSLVGHVAATRCARRR
jgi:ComEC/Rec2-related protein